VDYLSLGLAHKNGCHGNVPLWSKTNFRSFIYSHSSTNPANLAKIGPVGVEIMGLTESLKDKKNKYETKLEHKPKAQPKAGY